MFFPDDLARLAALSQAVSQWVRRWVHGRRL